MTKTSVIAALLALAGAAQAQTCSCDSSAARTPTNADLVSLLSNKMACGQVGGEQWQEWHNGSTQRVIDYKLGPNHPVDPSADVGSYSVSNNTVTYAYSGGGGTYTYEVCLASGGGSYTFCGPRTITGVTIGGLGLTQPQACGTFRNAPMPNSTGSKPRVVK
jgi:hypothetical protein